jgi:hypothetical protein
VRLATFAIAALLAALAVVGACHRAPSHELDLDAIEIAGATMRTDTVGGGEFTDTATFVLVDAKNTATEGAYVTLGGDLIDEGGTAVGHLALQSLWIPAGETRTFALVDTERKARPTAKTARAVVRGALVGTPPTVHLEDFHSFDDHGQVVVAAYLVNDAERDGTIMVVATFHDPAGRPLTRPFSLVKIRGKRGPVVAGDCPDAGRDVLPQASKCTIQFVGPRGATSGMMFVGDTVY